MTHRKTAKTPAEVKEWIKQPHHWGQVLDAKKNTDPKPGEAAYLQLVGGNARDGHWEILIPKEVHEKCFLKPCLNGTHMYEWDDEAETHAFLYARADQVDANNRYDEHGNLKNTSR